MHIMNALHLYYCRVRMQNKDVMCTRCVCIEQSFLIPIERQGRKKKKAHHFVDLFQDDDMLKEIGDIYCQCRKINAKQK